MYVSVVRVAEAAESVAVSLTKGSLAVAIGRLNPRTHKTKAGSLGISCTVRVGGITLIPKILLTGNYEEALWMKSQS